VEKVRVIDIVILISAVVADTININIVDLGCDQQWLRNGLTHEPRRSQE
jgi:hypothetical protein